MKTHRKSYPIVDLHCDLTHYLATVTDAAPNRTADIGCALPRLGEGNVRIQVMAISSIEQPPDVTLTAQQVIWFRRLIDEYGDIVTTASEQSDLDSILASDRVTIIPAIENAAALCANDEPVTAAFTRLDEMIDSIGRPLYISLTHHGETRFGGGNMTTLGLKDDGRALCRHLNGRGIALDLSHTSDALAGDILRLIDGDGLDVPVMASHSNYRDIWNHPRNLPRDLAREIMARGGIIGLNLLRAFLDNDDPDALLRHIEYALKLGGEAAVCLGVDYFYTATHPDQNRQPFYHPAHEHAGMYPEIVGSIEDAFGEAVARAVACENAAAFIAGRWGC